MDVPTESSRPLTDAWLQQFIDTARRDQSVIRVPAGRYRLHDSLRLRSNVHLVADGPVILEKVPAVHSRLIDVVGYGHSEFRVADPHLFRPGMGIAISAGHTVGFGTTVARVIDQEGDTFFTDTPFHRDYRPSEQATVWSMYPLLAGYGVESVRISGFTLDGGDNDPGYLDGCRGGGVYLLGCRNIELDGLEVRRYRGDGISFQQCVDIWIRNCHVHHNHGHGLHPGSGSVRYVIAANRIHDNGACGIYYCLRTTHSLCRDNEIHANGAEGISIGERDTDHRIDGNSIVGNAKAGLKLRTPVVAGADRLVIAANRFAANQKAAAGSALEIGPRHRSVHVLDNWFEPAGTAIGIAGECEDIVLSGNVYGAAPLPAEHVKSDSPIAGGQAAPPPLRTGPAALPLTGARHLRIERLPAWQDRPEEALLAQVGKAGKRSLANAAAYG